MKIVNIVLLCAATLAASTTANARECEKPSTSLEEANACVEELRKTAEATSAALRDTWGVFKDPLSVIEYVEFGELRKHVGEKDASLQAWSAVHNGTLALDPARNGWALSALRNYFSDPVRFEVVSKQLRSRAMAEIKKASAGGAVQSMIEHVRPLLEKPLDALLANQGMKWAYDNACLSVHLNKDQKLACAASPFHNAFKEHYGIEVTRDSVWLMGFLLRRGLENRKLVPIWQREILEGLKDLEAS
jgi:hypothetical protein